MSAPANNPQTTIKLSLRGVLLGLLAIFGVGIAGGILGAQYIAPPLPPLTQDGSPLVTNVQEVTISPSTAAAQLVEQHERAILILGETTTSDVRFLGTGVVLTNDGLIVSTADIEQNSIAFDNTGRALRLNKVGEDVLYGLVYYRLTENVVTPFQLADADPQVGSTLLSVARSDETLAPVATSWEVVEYGTPTDTAPLGWRRTARIATAADVEANELTGSPLLTDEGSLAGIIVDIGSGEALAVSDIRASLQRVTAGQRELNPFEKWGIRLAYDFIYDPEERQHHFAAQVQSVAPATPAAAARLAAGDRITKVNDTEIAWTTNVVELFMSDGPLTITFERQGASQTATLTLTAPAQE